MQGWN